jgi:myo-inositol-1(or 4)-monophosphatase
MTPRDDLDLAVRAATGAATVADTLFRTTLTVHTKGAAGDVVTDADLQAEAFVRRLITTERPADGLLGEEGSAVAGERRWLVDAIDGTLNFIRGDPFWCAAVALEDADGPLVAAVHHAASGETFSAIRGEGCWRNGEPVILGPGVALDNAVLATYPHPGDEAVATFQRVLGAVASPRIRGSGSLELAWLTAGRVDAWLQRDVNAWDWIPGSLLVTEAGGVCDTVSTAEGSWSFASARAASSELRRVVAAP